MNLFLNPSERELRKLISQAEKTKPVHDVVVDFDGEVLLDPQLRQPELDLDKFKVHIKLSEHIRKIFNKKPERLKVLFHTLVSDWSAMYNSASELAFDC